MTFNEDKYTVELVPEKPDFISVLWLNVKSQTTHYMMAEIQEKTQWHFVHHMGVNKLTKAQLMKQQITSKEASSSILFFKKNTILEI